MKVFLVLALVAVANAAVKRQNFPFQPYFRGAPAFEYQNVKSTPCGSSTQAPVIINSGYISSTPSSILENSGYISSTPTPIVINSGIISGALQGQEFGSSTPSPLIEQNSGFVTSTLPPVINSGIISSQGQIGGEIVSSTPQPDIGFNENAFSSTVGTDLNLNHGYLSSTPAPVLTGGYGQFGQSGAEQFINIETNSLSNSFLQNIPSSINDYNSVQVHTTTSGGSLDEAFGVSEDFESQSQRPEITKNVYFFAAPEEPEPIRPRIYFEPSKKNVNLIFVKAPVQAPLGPIEITPPQQESPEKTVVYVLVKKPEQQQNILVKSRPADKPRKPEVYFLKYKNEEEAQHTIAKVQSEHHINQEHPSALELNESHELFNIESAKYGINKRPIVEYANDRTFLQQQAQSGFPNGLTSTTESTLSTLGNLNTGLNSGFKYDSGLYQSSINSLPLIYSTPRPQVQINEIGSNLVKDEFINIGGRPLNQELFNPVVTSTVSPFIGSSTISPVSPCDAAKAASSTISPEISSLNPFYKKK